MTGSHIIVETSDGPMPTYRSAPDGHAKGAIVVVQEAFGVTSHIEDVTRRFAEAGWLAIAPALFHREGSPVLGYTELDRVMTIMGRLTSSGITDDIESAFDHLEAQGFPPDRSGIVGFCMGGSVTFVGAVIRPLAAAVTYYGGGVTEGRFGFPPLADLAPTLATPWLGHFGDLDKGIPVDQVETLRTATAGASVDTMIHRYADADHGFNCNDRPNVFNSAASALAWGRTLGWFDTHLRKA